ARIAVFIRSTDSISTTLTILWASEAGLSFVSFANAIPAGSIIDVNGTLSSCHRVRDIHFNDNCSAKPVHWGGQMHRSSVTLKMPPLAQQGSTFGRKTSHCLKEAE